MAVQEAVHNEFVGARGRARQPDGMKMAEAVRVVGGVVEQRRQPDPFDAPWSVTYPAPGDLTGAGRAAYADGAWLPLP